MFLRQLSKSRQFCIRNITRYHHVLLPSTREASAILPIISNVQTKSTEGYNHILTQLAQEGRSIQAQTLYDNIFRHYEFVANMDTYSQLMLAYINDHKYEDAMEIYYQLRDHQHKLDANTFALLIQSLTTITESHPTFDPAVEPMYVYSVQDSDSYIHTNIDGESQTSLLTALTLFSDMRQLEIQPTTDMYINMLKACERQKDSYVLDKVHKLIRMDIYLDPNVDIFNHLMKAYQSVDDPQSVLEIWDIAESGLFNETSVAIVTKTCLDHGYQLRLDSIQQKALKS